MELSLGCRREPPGPSVDELVKVADDQGSEGPGHLMSSHSGSYRSARFGTWVETERVLSGRTTEQGGVPSVWIALLPVIPFAPW